MGKCEDGHRIPGWKEMQQLPAQWELYKRLVEGVPEGIAVKDVLVGNHWAYVEAESGCGMAMVVHGGRGLYGLYPKARCMELRDLAAQCVSWNFLEASVGVAALNAWYSTPENAAAAGMKIEEKGSNDGFDLYRSLCAGKRVTVVGHFPLIERLADECELTVLERNPHGDDVPDPGCEYIIPHQDVTFMTGITLTNKTMPRLLQLSRESGGSAILVGPSVVPAPVLYEYGVDCMAGSIIVDPERAKAAVMQAATSGIFKHGVQKMRVERPGWLESLK
ncbi:DUF364 domain-containing protein [Denitrobacterium detoxificans]|uniref:Heavy-metal chelation n=1 Tax=Denitrobacterium detoxificans TaxID=79604 RepID=A0A1H8PAV5_9ACTN|nr:DUF364 domain-containing protein [Denitrobacterium detoxificans]SEO38758.1 hypothetical protein SAMN02910314_00081 [Denitrobacterium detoxificans]